MEEYLFKFESFRQIHGTSFLYVTLISFTCCCIYKIHVKRFYNKPNSAYVGGAMSNTNLCESRRDVLESIRYFTTSYLKDVPRKHSNTNIG